MRTVRALYLLVLLAAPLTIAQSQPQRSLARPDVEFAEPFTNVVGVRELKDGRVVVVDNRDKVVQLVDFKSGSATKIGREGSGPKEYALPMNVVGLPGDTSAVYDPLNRRLLVILPNGAPGEFMTIDQGQGASAGGGRMMMISMSPPRFSDARGRLYFSGSGVRMGAEGPVEADSIAILRYDRSTKKTDTVGYTRAVKGNQQVSGSQGRMQFRVGMANPFAPRDEWAVTPDGRVAVVRSPEYRVDWVTPSKGPGTPIAYEKIKFTNKHKELWRQSQRGATMIMMTNDNGRVSTQSGAAAQANIPEPTDWPEVMPPFLQNGLLVAPNGNIWVSRTRDGNDDVPKYDVIDASGKVIERVLLPKKTRVIAVGANTLLTLRTDDDDLQYLQRFKY
jgi:hypothetical protein